MTMVVCLIAVHLMFKPAARRRSAGLVGSMELTLGLYNTVQEVKPRSSRIFVEAGGLERPDAVFFFLFFVLVFFWCQISPKLHEKVESPPESQHQEQGCIVVPFFLLYGVVCVLMLRTR